MTKASNQYIVTTERGLALRGTRITLYDVMDYLKADYPHKSIRDIFNLTDEQMNGVLAYIEAHQAEVEAEYQEVLQTAQEIRQYWQERNRERLAKISAAPPRSGYEAVRLKLIERRMQREVNNK